jgi:hypothetical protein
MIDKELTLGLPPKRSNQPFKMDSKPSSRIFSAHTSSDQIESNLSNNTIWTSSFKKRPNRWKNSPKV